MCRARGEVIEMVNEGGPLGIHVVPDYDDSGRYVQYSVDLRMRHRFLDS